MIVYVVSLRRIGMTKKVGLLIVVLGACTLARAGFWRIEGGSLELNGALTGADITVSNGAALYGAGLVRGNGLIGGALSPGARQTLDAQTFTVASNVLFKNGSTLDLYAASHTNLDLLTAGGAVSGDCTVVISSHSNAIPLDQVVIDSTAAADYDGFGLTGSDSTNYMLETVAVGDLTLTDLIGDTDGDGLPDYWENDFYAGRTNATGGADSDGDTMNSRGEFFAGTNPTNDQDALMLQGVLARSVSNTMVVCWSSVSNRSYRLLCGSNLTDAASVSSVIASNIAATPPLNYYTNVVTDYEQNVYRVQLEL